MEGITIYAAEGCPKCAALKKQLDEKSITYSVCSDVDYMLSRGFDYIPMLEVGNEVMNYKQALKWVREQ